MTKVPGNAGNGKCHGSALLNRFAKSRRWPIDQKTNFTLVPPTRLLSSEPSPFLSSRPNTQGCQPKILAGARTQNLRPVSVKLVFWPGGQREPPTNLFSRAGP